VGCAFEAASFLARVRPGVMRVAVRTMCVCVCAACVRGVGLHICGAVAPPLPPCPPAQTVVSQFSMLFEWAGTDPALDPVLLMAHQDVVSASKSHRHPLPPPAPPLPSVAPSHTHCTPACLSACPAKLPVQVPTAGQNWTVDPFEGLIRDGFVWGRCVVYLSPALRCTELSCTVMNCTGVMWRDMVCCDTGGRGAIDDKQAIISIMESLEHLIASGFAPTRTLMLVFGHDEVRQQ
jgi:hypothetical protein